MYKQQNPEKLKNLVITVLLSLMFILPLNILPIAAYLLGFFPYPPSEDFGSSMMSSIILLLLMNGSYLSIGYFGFIKRRLGLLDCLAATIICFAITFFVTYEISGYLFASGRYVNPPDAVPIGFWHYKASNSMWNGLLRATLVFRLGLELLYSLISGISIPLLLKILDRTRQVN